MLRPLYLLAVVFLALLAGCTGQEALPEVRTPAAVQVVDVGTATYEPSIAIDAGGRVFVNGFEEEVAGRPAWGVWRSEDGAGWMQVLDEEDRTPSNNDPWLWLDPLTDRIFSMDLVTVTCSWLAWSDDAGESWESLPAAGCGLPGHHFQKLTGGPPAQGTQTQGYPNVLYYSTTSLRDPDPANPTDLIVGGTGTDVSVSLDGGRSWSLAVRVHPPTPGGYSQAGPIAVGPDGTAWSPAQTDDGVRIARSTDSGITWSLVATLTDAGYQPYGADPSLAVDDDGILYLLHASADNLPVLRTSLDGGITWTEPLVVSPPGVTSVVLPLVRVFDDGLAMAYLGTTDEAGDPSFATPDVSWRLYLATAKAPVTVADVTTVFAEEDPVQRGCVWMRGGLSSPCRNLGDFIGLAARDGLVAAAIVDGCNACAEGTQSTGTAARVALWRPLGSA